MSQRSSAGLVVFGAVVVALSGLASYFGASLAHRDPPSVPEPRELDAERFDALSRKLSEIQEQLDLATENARTALELARKREEAAPVAPAPAQADPAKGNDGSGGGATEESLHPTEGAPDRNDGADGQMAKLTAMSKVVTEGRVLHAMSLYTDATKEGAVNRQSQANADALALMHRYGLKGEDVEAKLKAVFQDEWARGAREIGPIVHDGLAKADIATVRERLRTLYAETDRQLKPHLDDETWRLYGLAADGWRAMGESVLEEYEAKRLNKR